jgi:hypothetical protein
MFWQIADGPSPILARSGNLSLSDGFDFGTFVGGGLDFGIWCNARHTIGLTGSGFILEERSTFAGFASDAAGNPAITRPIFDAQNLSAVEVLVASPGVFSGSILQSASSRFAGGDAAFIANVAHCQGWSLDATFGFRYLDLDEDLVINQTSQALGQGALTIAGIPVGALSIEDRFNTRNQFYGGYLGFRSECRMGPVFANVHGSVALGPNHEVIEITGLTSEVGGTGLVAPGGLLAAGFMGGPLGGNIGRQITNRFTVVPEVTGRVGFQLFRSMRAWVGYGFLYMNDVARPGSQIDLAINPRVVPASPAFGSTSGPAVPRSTGSRNDFFAHGVQFGLEMRY